jgi:hypothetical protein
LSRSTLSDADLLYWISSRCTMFYHPVAVMDVNALP